MSEREYAVWVFDSAPGAGERIVPVGNRRRGEAMVEHYRQIHTTRDLYGVAAKVVFRYRFMPDMPWWDAE